MFHRNPINERIAEVHTMPRAMPADGYWGWRQMMPDITRLPEGINPNPSRRYMPSLRYWPLSMFR
jgi:hypothetical protein